MYSLANYNYLFSMFVFNFCINNLHITIIFWILNLIINLPLPVSYIHACFMLLNSILSFQLEELPLAFLIMWLCQQQNLSALDYLRNSTSPSFLKYRFTGYRILVNSLFVFLFLSALYKCYPIASGLHHFCWKVYYQNLRNCL